MEKRSAENRYGEILINGNTLGRESVRRGINKWKHAWLRIGSFTFFRKPFIGRCHKEMRHGIYRWSMC